MIHTRSAGAKSHRDRKNGASREEWQARKAARNAERPSATLDSQGMGARMSVLCPKCGRFVNTSWGHGEWFPSPTYKRGWDVEMDGSPLQPPVPTEEVGKPAQPQEVPAEQRPEVCGEHAPGQTQDVACTLPKSHEGNHCHAWSTVKFFWPAQKESK